MKTSEIVCFEVCLTGVPLKCGMKDDGPNTVLGVFQGLENHRFWVS
jgi:hypothetical protein